MQLRPARLACTTRLARSARASPSASSSRGASARPARRATSAAGASVGPAGAVRASARSAGHHPACRWTMSARPAACCSSAAPARSARCRRSTSGPKRPGCRPGVALPAWGACTACAATACSTCSSAPGSRWRSGAAGAPRAMICRSTVKRSSRWAAGCVVSRPGRAAHSQGRSISVSASCSCSQPPGWRASTSRTGAGNKVSANARPSARRSAALAGAAASGPAGSRQRASTPSPSARCSCSARLRWSDSSTFRPPAASSKRVSRSRRRSAPLTARPPAVPGALHCRAGWRPRRAAGRETSGLQAGSGVASRPASKPSGRIKAA